MVRVRGVSGVGAVSMPSDRSADPLLAQTPTWTSFSAIWSYIHEARAIGSLCTTGIGLRQRRGVSARTNRCRQVCSA